MVNTLAIINPFRLVHVVESDVVMFSKYNNIF